MPPEALTEPCKAISDGSTPECSTHYRRRTDDENLHPYQFDTHDLCEVCSSHGYESCRCAWDSSNALCLGQDVREPTGGVSVSKRGRAPPVWIVRSVYFPHEGEIVSVGTSN